MFPISRALLFAATLAAALPTAADAQAGPTTGRTLLQQMQRAYQGKWYTSLTFTQATTTRRPDGTQAVATWYESLRYTEANGTQLRIDTGEPSAGNGVLYSADSLWVMRAGKLAAARKGGNALLPLIEGVYVQPVERTIADLAQTAVDLDRPVVGGRWNDRPVLIAGATSPADTASPQFWVDAERNVVVRAILVPAPGAPKMDIRLENLVPLAGGWLAARCAFYVAGSLVQAEEYSDWKANVQLPAALFDVGSWTTAPHWAAKGRTP